MLTVFQNQSEIRRFCEKMQVKRLYLTGQVVNDPDLNPLCLEFLVAFENPETPAYFELYYGLCNALEELFGLQIYLTDIDRITNPAVLKNLNRNRELLYP